VLVSYVEESAIQELTTEMLDGQLTKAKIRKFLKLNLIGIGEYLQFMESIEEDINDEGIPTLD
jgi:hypothetical protein